MTVIIKFVIIKEKYNIRNCSNVQNHEIASQDKSVLSKLVVTRQLILRRQELDFVPTLFVSKMNGRGMKPELVRGMRRRKAH